VAGHEAGVLNEEVRVVEQDVSRRGRRGPGVDLEEVVAAGLVAGQALNRARGEPELDQAQRSGVQAGAGLLVSQRERGRRDIRDHERLDAAVAVLGGGVGQREAQEDREVGRNGEQESVPLARVVQRRPAREGGAPHGVLEAGEHGGSWMPLRQNPGTQYFP